MSKELSKEALTEYFLETYGYLSPDSWGQRSNQIVNGFMYRVFRHRQVPNDGLVIELSPPNAPVPEFAIYEVGDTIYSIVDTGANRIVQFSTIDYFNRKRTIPNKYCASVIDYIFGVDLRLFDEVSGNRFFTSLTVDEIKAHLDNNNGDYLLSYSAALSVFAKQIEQGSDIGIIQRLSQDLDVSSENTARIVAQVRERVDHEAAIERGVVAALYERYKENPPPIVARIDEIEV